MANCTRSTDWRGTSPAPLHRYWVGASISPSLEGTWDAAGVRRKARIDSDVSMIVSALANRDDLPADYDELTGVAYGEALERLPEWCDHTDRFRDVWAEEDASLEASTRPGAFTVDERSDVDLAVVTVAPDASDAGGHRFGVELQ